MDCRKQFLRIRFVSIHYLSQNLSILSCIFHPLIGSQVLNPDGQFLKYECTPLLIVIGARTLMPRIKVIPLMLLCAKTIILLQHFQSQEKSAAYFR